MIELFKNNWVKNLSKCFIPMAYVVGQNTLGLVLHQFNWPNLGQSSRFYAHNNNKKGSSELLFSNSEGASELGCKRNSIDIANAHCCLWLWLLNYLVWKQRSLWGNRIHFRREKVACTCSSIPIARHKIQPQWIINHNKYKRRNG